MAEQEEIALMSGSATTSLEQAVLGHTLGYAPMIPPATVYVGLCTADTPPTAATGGNEIPGFGYTRVPATFEAGLSPDLAVNATAVAFPFATADWGTIGWFELWDSVYGGQRLYWGQFIDPTDGVTPLQIVVNQGGQLRIPPGQLTVQAI